MLATAGNPHCHDNIGSCHMTSRIQNECFSFETFLDKLLGFVRMCLLKSIQSILTNEMHFRSALDPLINAFAWITEDGLTPLPYKLFYKG